MQLYVTNAITDVAVCLLVPLLMQLCVTNAITDAALLLMSLLM